MPLLIPDKPWAITQAAYEAVIEVINRERPDKAQAEQRRDEHIARAVEFYGATRLDGARYTTVRNGVAIVDVYGPIARRANLFSEISGGSSVDMLARDYQVAMASPAVHSILSVFDSPGGEVGGVSELAAYLYAQRGAKPMTAYVDVMACSAAYWLAAAHDQIVTNDTALTGSIGVVMTVPDPTKTTTKDLQFVSSRSPNKRPDVTTEAGKGEVQSLVDSMADVFIQAVATYRGTTPDAVVSDYGAGGVRVGQQAVLAGLADTVGDFETTLAEMVRRHQDSRMGAPRRQGGSMSDTTQTNQEFLASAVLGSGTTATSATADEFAAMKAEMARLRKENIDTKAAAFAERMIAAERIVPGQRDALASLYAALAEDDGARPLDAYYAAKLSSRALALEAFVASYKPHGLGKEMIPADATLLALANNTGQAAADKQAAAEKEKEDLKSLTPLGRQAAAAQNGGK